MKIFNVFYSNNEQKNKIKIINPNFLDKNKGKYKIIYNNKIYPLQSEFIINEKKIKQIKVKLLCYVKIQNTSNITKECKSFEISYENNKYKKIMYNCPQYLIYPLHELSQIIYKNQIIKGKISIFGENFVKNNKDKCFIIYKNKIFPLTEYFHFNNIEKEDTKLEIILIELQEINDRSYMFDSCYYLEEFPLLRDESEKKAIISEKYSYKENSNIYNEFYSESKTLCLEEKAITEYNTVFSCQTTLLELFPSFSFKFDKYHLNNSSCTNMTAMFDGCSSLISLPDISKWNTKNVINMSNIFNECSSLIVIPKISKWNTCNVINMSHMFHGCSTLMSLPDISKWNTGKVINMSNMFHGCSTLMSLPDISKWKIDNVRNLKSIFNKCSSIISLPDISKWNTINVTNMKSVFDKCSSIVSLPDLSHWNTNNVIDLSNMFRECSSLRFLPDISNWNTINVSSMSSMFDGCSSLITLPDISKWNTINLNFIDNIFGGCSSLISLPDISKLKTDNVINMMYMFYQCSSLTTLPDISIWNMNDVTDISNIFEGCSSLISLPDISKWNIENIENASEIFIGCLSLSYLPDISMWDIMSLKTNINTFEGCVSNINYPTIPLLNQSNNAKSITKRSTKSNFIRAKRNYEFNTNRINKMKIGKNLKEQMKKIINIENKNKINKIFDYKN